MFRMDLQLFGGGGSGSGLGGGGNIFKGEDPYKEWVFGVQLKSGKKIAVRVSAKTPDEAMERIREQKKHNKDWAGYSRPIPLDEYEKTRKGK